MPTFAAPDPKALLKVKVMAWPAVQSVLVCPALHEMVTFPLVPYVGAFASVNLEADPDSVLATLSPLIPRAV